jgi:hypothetical protein
MVKTVNQKMPLMSNVRPDLGIPEPVDLVVAKALQKNPKDRHASAVDFAKDLQLACQATGFTLVKGNDQKNDGRLQNQSQRVNERTRGPQ